MYEILDKEKIARNSYRMKIEAPYIAEERQPGQFVILSVHGEYGERIPLTIVDSDTDEGSITVIFQVVGYSTDELSKLNPGDSLPVLLGPLGNPTHIGKIGHVVCVGGGIGVAPLYPITKALYEAGNTITAILGAQTKELLILQNEMQALSRETIVCTDDGSYGREGVVTGPLGEVCEQQSRPDLVVAIGPPVMMKFCAETTRPYGIKTMVSLNTIMVDGTGMCGGCRVNVGGETKFVCVDGPEFDGHEGAFDEMINRLSAYTEKEKQTHEEKPHSGCCLEGERR